MYVCICNSVTDRDIAEAVDRGARTLAQLEESLGVGTRCGRCRDTANDCLHRFQSTAATGLAFQAAL